MPKLIDASDVPVRRTRRTGRLEIFTNENGSLSHILAHRWLHTRQAGVDIAPPVYQGVVRVEASALTQDIKTALVAIEALVDAADV